MHLQKSDLLIMASPTRFVSYLLLVTAGCLKNVVARLCGYCGGAVDSIISFFRQLHRSSFKLNFETLFE